LSAPRITILGARLEAVAAAPWPQPMATQALAGSLNVTKFDGFNEEHISAGPLFPPGQLSKRRITNVA
jgi:hypothetical protein